MYCRKCGVQLQDGAMFCSQCGTPVAEESRSGNVNIDVKKEKPKKKNYTFLVVIVLVAALVVAHFIAYSGYKTFLRSYLDAIESGDEEAILACHSWEDVQEKNKENQNSQYSSMFVWENLEDYVSSNDDLYDARIMGHEILSWEITDSNRNYFTLSNPAMWVEVYITLEGASDDVVATINMEKGNDGWYATRVDAAWVSHAETD